MAVPDCAAAKKLLLDQAMHVPPSCTKAIARADRVAKELGLSDRGAPLRGGRYSVPAPFRSGQLPESDPAAPDLRNGVVLSTGRGCTMNEMDKLELYGHPGVRVVECIDAEGAPLPATHADAHYCAGIDAYPAFKTVDNKQYDYPYATVK